MRKNNIIASRLRNIKIYDNLDVISGLDLLLFVFGSLINTFAYLSIQPLIVAILVFGIGFGILLFGNVGGYYERRMYSKTFIMYWLISGVSAVYANHFNDMNQLYSDAGGFFLLASDNNRLKSIDEIKKITNGSFAVIIWGNTYDFFSWFGIARERFIGILINILAVSFTGVISIKTARILYGNDFYRFQRLIILFTYCGMFWLFAGIHVRDAIVLFFITSIVYVWVLFLSKPYIDFKFILIILVTFFSGPILSNLRDNFFYLPIGVMALAVTALMFSKKKQRSQQITYFFLIVGLIISGYLISTYFGNIGDSLKIGNENYSNAVHDAAASGSLGASLIVNQSLPVRLIFGAISLFVYPIPIWDGFQLESAYHLFKALNTIFFYGVIPLFVLSIYILIQDKSLHSPQFLFLVFLFFVFLYSVVMTSLETRHLGVFYVPLLLLVLIPDLRQKIVKDNYKKLLSIMLWGMVIVHLFWVILKYH